MTLMEQRFNMKVLKEIVTPHGTIRITKYNKTINYHQNNVWQSSTDGAGYMNRMFDKIKEANFTTVLMVGCGGGILAKRLCEINCKVTVVDILEESFIIAKEFFELPNEVNCIVSDGIEYLLKAKGVKYDCIIVDAYDGKFKSLQFNNLAIMALNLRLQATGKILFNRYYNGDNVDRINSKYKERALAL